mgnify:CR=1 FL=1
MKFALKILQTNLEILQDLETSASVRHVEFDKMVVRTECLEGEPASSTAQKLEFALWHRNIVFEEDSIRIAGFALFEGVMGQVECLLTSLGK